MKNLRLKEKTWRNIKHHPDFDEVSKGDENVFIVTVGWNSGTVHTDIKNYDHYSNIHLFLKAKNTAVVENIVGLQDELQELANVTMRVRSCGLPQIIDAYDRMYGRPNVLLDNLTTYPE